MPTQLRTRRAGERSAYRVIVECLLVHHSEPHGEVRLEALAQTALAAPATAFPAARSAVVGAGGRSVWLVSLGLYQGPFDRIAGEPKRCPCQVDAEGAVANFGIVMAGPRVAPKAVWMPVVERWVRGRGEPGFGSKRPGGLAY